MSSQEKLNFDDLSIELQLILALVNEEEITHLDGSHHMFYNDINWDLFIQFSSHHRVFPVLYERIKTLGTDIIPSFIIKHLNKQYKQNTFRMLYFSAETKKISRLFHDNDIRLLFLKGPVLGHELYGDISLRTSSDLDVLIPLDQLDVANELIKEEGYERKDYFQTVLNDWKWRHHHLTYVHQETGIKLEVHWRLHPGPGKEPHFNDLWLRKCPSDITNYPVYTLGREDLFVFLCMHGSRHGWSRLRWLMDMSQLMKQTLDWDKINTLLKMYHVEQLGGQCIILASQLLRTKTSKEMNILLNCRSEKLAKKTMFYLENRVNLHTDPIPADVSQYHKSYLFSSMAWQQKLIFILSFMYPYPEDIETLPLPKTLHFMYFPLRPFLWAWRKTKKLAFP